MSHFLKPVIAVTICSLMMMPAIAEPAQSKLQIINGSQKEIRVDLLKSEAEKIPNGTIPPGEFKIISTVVGQKFSVTGQDGGEVKSVTSMVPIQGVRYDPPSPDGVPDFYTQQISAGGFPIVASAKVNPYALKEAAYLINMMFAKRSDLCEAMTRSGARMCILAWNEFTTDQPEFAAMKPKDFWDARARGLGGSEEDPYCSCAEENLLGYPGDPYSTECILIHEFAHCIHLRGMANLDPTFDGRVKSAYEAAMKAGLWKGKYAATNDREYFAEGVQSWFDNNRENDREHNHVNTRVELVEYDPGLAALCREVFGETELRYTKPATRLTGHMAGYDPAKAPTFVWPERLREKRDTISNGKKR